MRAVRNVVAVHVRATGVPPGRTPHFGIARVEVIDRIKGDATPAILRYSRGPCCCPMRIEAGNDYIVFMDTDAKTVDVTMENIVAVPVYPASGYTYDRDGRFWREILSGRRALSDGFRDTQLQRISAFPPPPPPPPHR